jgi:flagellar secretion chaperone FliS
MQNVMRGPVQDSRISSYREAEVLGKSKEQLVPFLYQHLLANLRRAAGQIAARDLEGKSASIERAQAILYELLSSLDFDAGGELASRLSALYAFFLGETAEASRTLDTGRLERLIEMVRVLHEAWEQAAVGNAPDGDEAGAGAGAAS